ncbi:armadillo repeat-containing protein 3 [Formica exsecta]|uniref:armadillo repeat-containing protein 3 n=1 Tax=Formica exsecta TaxID=72781 RepID=UPI0011430469|nr:armadillo repeat-containing protein 3 [Formica exsecta]
MQAQNSKNDERGEQEEDEKEAELKYSPFRSSLFEAKDVESTILLLQSKEKATLLAVIEALSKYANKSKDNVKILFDLGIMNNILPIIEHKDLFTRRFAAKLLVEMMAMPDVTTYLIESNYLLRFAKLLTSEEDIFMQEYFSTILAKLSKNPYATALLANHCLNMNFLFDGIQSSDPDVKKNNIEILYNLIQDPVAARTILKTEDYLLQLIKQFVEQVPIETCIIFLEALLAIACCPKFRDTLINLDTFDTIFLLLESIYPFLDELKISCCNLLSVLCLEKNGRHYFIKANGPQKFYSLITDMHSISIRNSAVQLVQTISTDLIVANAFVENKYLSYMLNNPLSSRVIPSWDTCIETLFKSHLPIKFALTGRLSLQDLTQDGFYVLRRNICPFPVLDDIFRFKYCPLEPIYVVNCVQSSTLSNALQAAFKENINVLSESKFGRLQYDPYFTEYVELFKCMILATESKRDVNASDKLTNIRYVPLRARMLAQFVARQMSGFDSTSKCIDHQLEVHLREIKECLEMSVIPIGQLRVGSYLERALLFKAIADRICLPAALVRGEYGISWIEIAVPQMEDSNEEKLFSAYLDENDACREEIVTSVSPRLLDKSNVSLHHNEHKIEKISSSKDYRSTFYPTKLIKTNFIVDLMDIPGDLIPIGSLRSKLYCSKKMIYNKICCH